MTPDDLTPERLDAILNGSEPATSDAERDMLSLAASLRDAAPHAGDDLRDRVRAIAAPAPTGRETRRRGPGWRTRLLIAAPALATVTAAVVVIAVVGGDDPVKNQTSLTSAESAGAATTTTAQAAARSAADTVKVAPSPQAARPELGAGPITVRVEPGTLQQRIADARRIVRAAGGTVNKATRQTSAEPGALLEITLPPDRASAAIAKLVGLGEGGDGAAGGGTVRLLLTERTAP